MNAERFPFVTSSAELVPRRARVLTVVDGTRVAGSCVALARGVAAARQRGAELYVLYVTRDDPRRSSRPRGPFGSVLEHLRSEKSGRVRRLIAGRGDPIELAMRVTRQVGVDLVIAGARAGSGGGWARVARRRKIPVLVVRPSRKNQSILAAVDFTDPAFPVLARATAVASRLGGRARVLLLHNVDPGGRVFTRGTGISLTRNAVRKLRDARAEKLHELAAAHLGAQGLVSSNHDPVTAIVEHATRCDADLVVVGAHPGRWRREPSSEGTAARVVERAHASTLVVPLSVTACAA